MKTIKINFASMPSEFNLHDNFILDILKRRYNVIFSDDPDFLFYSVFDMSFLKFHASVKIFICGEPIIPNFNDCDYAIGFPNIIYDDRYFQANAIFASLGKGIKKDLQDRSSATSEMHNRRFCNFIYSNSTHGEGAALRQEFCRLLMKYKTIDCLGRVMNNMSSSIGKRYELDSTLKPTVKSEAWAEKKIESLRSYKFTIAFENTALADYVTEKIYHPLEAYSIPIYWGAPNVYKYINPLAFINCAEHADFASVVERVIELDQNPRLYLQMLAQPPLQPDFPFSQKQRLTEFLYRIVERDRFPFSKNALNFTTVSAGDFIDQCRQGQVGIRKIIKALYGWSYYKITHRLKNLNNGNKMQ